ncbi:PD-(D/E)XK nuclease family protein [Mariniflexile sp. HNIBRBA6329]|uniref:PDDEXK-like family protein n=1 Tax=Mariniflexile sp. HNIBRBA6329 TaxID=3373088 RepID=UPI00374750A3
MSVTSQDLESFEAACQSDLHEIRKSLNAFNIFNVLGIQYREIRHSNFLGWLFSPNESHQLGDVFLRSLFKVINQVGLFTPEEYKVFSDFNVSKTEVYREEIHNIDILIVNKEHGFVITIENKIHANYSIDQLSKYHNYVVDNYTEFGKHIFLTLTPTRSESHKGFIAGENYTNINYQHIIDLIEANRLDIDKALPTVRESINQYKAMVEKDITHTSKEVLLAKEIYKKYKKEIDFIVKNQENFALYRDSMYNYIKNGGIEGFEVSHELYKQDCVFLLPKNDKLKELFHFSEAKSRGGDYIFSLVLELEKDAVWLKFGFGKINDCDNKKHIELIRTTQFDAMKKFECFKTPQFNINFHNDTATSSYPAICGVPLFNDDEYFESKLDVLELLQDRFTFINNQLIQPWVQECLAKL